MVLAKKDKISRCLIFGVVAAVGMMAVSCGDDDKLGVEKAIDASKMPQLSTRNVSTLISDSGYTKYKVLTPLWNVYNSNPSESYWDFPEGVYLRQFDKNFKVVSTVAADSACYFPQKKLWELYGDVEIDQKDKAFFHSQRIFFDDRQHKIYSDTFIHIKTPTQILEGIGFQSNQDMTLYRVLKPTGMFPTKEFREGGSDSHIDSLMAAPQPGVVPPRHVITSNP